MEGGRQKQSITDNGRSLLLKNAKKGTKRWVYLPVGVFTLKDVPFVSDHMMQVKRNSTLFCFDSTTCLDLVQENVKHVVKTQTFQIS